MGRWSHLDTDEERLPEGMTRIAYDADTQVYTYKDSDGSRWESAPGVRYGKLHRVEGPPPLGTFESADEPVEGDEPAYVLHDADDDGDSAKDLKFSPPPSPAIPEKAYLRRLGSLSKTTRRFLPKALPLSKDAALAIWDQKAPKATVTPAKDGKQQLQRRSTIASISKDASEGLKKMFSDDSEFRSRRG